MLSNNATFKKTLRDRVNVLFLESQVNEYKESLLSFEKQSILDRETIFELENQAISDRNKIISLEALRNLLVMESAKDRKKIYELEQVEEENKKMKRKIEQPRILLMDCGLEYTKGESQTDMELSKETDFARILELEEAYIKELCDNIIALEPTLVITEKGISDLAQHFLAKAGISAIRRVRKTDNLRIARACGATIVSRTDEMSENCIGTDAGLFEIKKYGEEYFTFITECKATKACSIILRGASKDVLMEVERNLQDAMQVARNIMMESKVVPGGGACELAVANHLSNKAKLIQGEEQFPFKAVSKALEVIPRTLSQNCGANTIRTLTELRAKHTGDAGKTMGVNGTTGKIADMNDLGVWEPLSVKLQVYKTAIETATLLLRIDDIVSGTKRADGQEGIGAVGAE
jgi:T-complex protein 1 subunit gamma